MYAYKFCDYRCIKRTVIRPIDSVTLSSEFSQTDCLTRIRGLVVCWIYSHVTYDDRFHISVSAVHEISKIRRTIFFFCFPKMCLDFDGICKNHGTSSRTIFRFPLFSGKYIILDRFICGKWLLCYGHAVRIAIYSIGRRRLYKFDSVRDDKIKPNNNTRGGGGGILFYKK